MTTNPINALKKQFMIQKTPTTQTYICNTSICFENVQTFQKSIFSKQKMISVLCWFYGIIYNLYNFYIFVYLCIFTKECSNMFREWTSSWCSNIENRSHPARAMMSSLSPTHDWRFLSDTWNMGLCPNTWNKSEHLENT